MCEAVETVTTEAENGEEWHVPEFAVANRASLPCPDIKQWTSRIMKYFSAPRMVLQFSDLGKSHFLAYCACFGAEQAALRESAENQAEAPRKGTGPWHLAVLSAAQLVMDIGVDEARHFRFRFFDVHFDT